MASLQDRQELAELAELAGMYRVRLTRGQRVRSWAAVPVFVGLVVLADTSHHHPLWQVLVQVLAVALVALSPLTAPRVGTQVSAGGLRRHNGVRLQALVEWRDVRAVVVGGARRSASVADLVSGRRMRLLGVPEQVAARIAEALPGSRSPC